MWSGLARRNARGAVRVFLRVRRSGKCRIYFIYFGFHANEKIDLSHGDSRTKNHGQQSSLVSWWQLNAVEIYRKRVKTLTEIRAKPFFGRSRLSRQYKLNYSYTSRLCGTFSPQQFSRHSPVAFHRVCHIFSRIRVVPPYRLFAVRVTSV